MNITRITAPATTPISLAEAKAHLRETTADNDAIITALIDAVTSYYDAWSGVMGRALINQTWEVTLDAFPDGPIRLPLGPVQSLTSITYNDTAGALQTVSAANYYLDTRSLDGWVVPKSDFDWPETLDAVNTVFVRYVAGFGAASTDVPAAVRQAMLIRLGTLYTIQQRDHTIRSEKVDGVGSVDFDVSGAAAVGLERVETALLAPFRRVRL